MHRSAMIILKIHPIEVEAMILKTGHVAKTYKISNSPKNLEFLKSKINISA